MPLLPCKRQFEDKIKSLIKRSTIRKYRKRPFKVGDILYMYVDSRTKRMRKIGEHICKKVSDIEVHVEDVVVDGIPLCALGLTNLRIKEGFDSIADFFNFFKKDIPFAGQLIEW